MASNVKEQTTENVKASSYYSIPLNESIDVNNIARIFTFIRFEDEKISRRKVTVLQSIA
jgi:hypothetical protein